MTSTAHLLARLKFLSSCHCLVASRRKPKGSDADGVLQNKVTGLCGEQRHNFGMVLKVLRLLQKRPLDDEH